MLNNLNKEQKEAVLFGKGPAIVLAGPGSGKTLVLTHRIQNLILHHHVNPSNILTITFTKAAAIEMKKRAVSMEKQAEGAVFGTFHSVFFQILKTSPQYSQYTILLEGEKKQIMKEILYHSQTYEEDIDTLIPKMLKEISYIRSKGISVEQYESMLVSPELFRQAYREYEKELRFRKKTDFDGILLLCFEYLKQNTKALSLWQNRFLYVLIDEFQDIDRVQYEIVKLLTEGHKNIFVVGDDDQAIYGFRGANPGFMREFLKDYENTTQIILGTNYRSNEAIVNTAAKCISHNKCRVPKLIVSGKLDEDKQENTAIILKIFQEENEEAEYLLDAIKNNEGPLEEIAVLFRTNQKAARFGELLFLHKIPYFMKEKSANFYDNVLIRDILAYLKFAHLEPRRSYFYQFMNKPVRYIKREAVLGEIVDFSELYIAYFGKKKILYSLKKLEEDLKFLKTLDAYGSISYVLKAMGYENYARTLAKGKIEAWKEQEEIIKEFLNRSKEFKSCKEFLFFIEQYSCYFKEEEQDKKKEKQGVRLMTYHGSKGLEFKQVYLPFLNKGIVPYHKAVTVEDIEEERRMFYVAITRAKEKLCFSATENSSLKKSNFLEELLKS